MHQSASTVNTSPLDREVTIASGRHAKDTKWENRTLTLRQFGTELSQCRVGEKDGSAFLQGSLAQNGARTATGMDAFELMTFDIDNGQPLDKPQSILRMTGIEGWIYPTFNDGMTETEVKADTLARWQKGAEAFDEAATAYLRTVEHYTADVLTSAKVRRRGLSFIVTHKPLARYRIVIPLSRPVSILELGATIAGVKPCFKAFYRSIAAFFGIEHFDESAADVVRLNYPYRRSRAEPSRFWRSEGQLFVPDNYVEKARNATAASAPVSAPDAGSYATPGLARKFADRRPFRAADFVMRWGDDPVPKNGGVEARCPNEAVHSPGGGQRPLFAINRDKASGGHAAIKCQHATCQGSLNLAGFVDMILQKHGRGADVLDAFFEGPAPGVLSEGPFAPGDARKKQTATPAPAVKTLTIRRASEIEAKPIDWLWRGRLAVSAMTLFAGDPGIGKSQIALSMAAAVSTGGLWPCGEGRAAKGSVIVLSAEDAPSEVLKPRLEAAGADCNNVYIVPSVMTQESGQDPQRRMLDLATDLAELEKAIRDIGDVRLIVIDPVTAYLGKSSSGKRSNAELRGVLDPMSEMAARVGVALLCVTHFRKPGADTPGTAMHAVIDSIAYTAAARLGFGGIRDPEDKGRVLFLELKQNLTSSQPGLAARVKSRVIGAGIETSAVEWEPQHVNVSADDLMGRKGSAGSTETADIADFLRAVLAAGPLDVKTIEKEARDAGLLEEGERANKSKPFRRAKDALKIVRQKLGMKAGWGWALPNSASVDFEDVTKQDVTTSPDQLFNPKLH